MQGWKGGYDDNSFVIVTEDGDGRLEGQGRGLRRIGGGRGRAGAGARESWTDRGRWGVVWWRKRVVAGVEKKRGDPEGAERIWSFARVDRKVGEYRGPRF